MTNEEKSTISCDAAEVLREALGRGDAKVVASALHRPVSHIYEMAAGERTTPHGATLTTLRALRDDGNNEGADKLFLWIARADGWVCHRPKKTLADVDYAVLLHQHSDVVLTRAEGASDGNFDAADCEKTAIEAEELAEAAVAYAASLRAEAAGMRASRLSIRRIG